ncbi:MAG: heparan-alpha-glucosaminide N-acetyltransferase domain-containing protein [Bacteroidota bacterium]
MTARNGTPRYEGARVDAIDQFRGLAILLMSLADFLSDVSSVPPWLKHAPDIGYTVIDLIAPMFVFAMGLTYGLSFRRRMARNGAWVAYEHAITRNLALVGLGFLLVLAGNMSGVYQGQGNWGLLQALGMAGLITLPFIRLRPGVRAAVGLLLLALYQYMLDAAWLPLVLGSTHNGIWGSLSWGGLLILSTVLGDLYHEEFQAPPGTGPARPLYAWTTAAVLLMGLALTVVAPISKNRASASYMLVSLGLSALLFGLFHLLEARGHFRLPVLTAWGRNALLLYLLHGAVIGLFALPPFPAWYVNAPPWLTALQAVLMVLILSAAGIFLDRRGWYWRL